MGRRGDRGWTRPAFHPPMALIPGMGESYGSSMVTTEGKADVSPMDRNSGWILATVLSVSLLLRLWGIGHGYPDFVTGDERAVIKDAVRFPYSGTLEPGHYNYPALYSYLFSGGLFVAYWSGWLQDVGGAGVSIGFAHLFHPGKVALVGRLLSALGGVGIAGLTYLLGRKTFGVGVGLGGALFAGISTTLVNQSRYALPDVTMALLATGACIFMVQIGHDGGRRAYLWAGALTGLAISAKYNAGMLVGGLAVAHWLRVRMESKGKSGGRMGLALGKGLVDYRLGLAGGMLLVSFILGTPYWLVAPGRYFQAVLEVSSNLQFSLGATEWPRLRLLVDFLQAELGWGVLAALGCLYGLWRRTPSDWILLAVVVPAFLYIGSWPKGGLHYAIYLLPLAGLLGARMMGELLCAGAIRWKLPPLTGRPGTPLANVALAAKAKSLMVAILVLVSLPQLWKDGEQGHRLNRPDLRIEAARWIEANIPDGTTIGVYRIDYSPPLKGDIHRNFLRARIRENARQSERVAQLRELDEQTPIYRQLTLEYFSEEPQVPEEYRGKVDLGDPKTLETFRRTWMEYAELKHWGVRYLALPSAGYSRFFTGQPPPKGTAGHYYFTRSRDYISQFFTAGDSRYRIVQEFAEEAGTAIRKISIVEVR